MSAPPPFGGNQRTIVMHLDPSRLRSYHLSPDEVIAALNAGNTITPAGNPRIQDQMPIVPPNAMVRDPQDLGDIPIRPGETLHLRDVGWIEDSTDIPTSFALVNCRRAVYMLVTKRADASTLSVVNEVMSFGSPTPIAVSIDSPDIAASRRHAEKVRDQLAHIDSLRDLQYVQSYNYPTVEVAVDRQRAGKSKVTTDEVARAMVGYTLSSRFVMPNYWVDPKSGTGYQVQVEVPLVQMDSMKEVELVTVKRTPGRHVSLRDRGATSTPATCGVRRRPIQASRSF